MSDADKKELPLSEVQTSREILDSKDANKKEVKTSKDAPKAVETSTENNFTQGSPINTSDKKIEPKVNNDGTGTSLEIRETSSIQRLIAETKKSNDSGMLTIKPEAKDIICEDDDEYLKNIPEDDKARKKAIRIRRYNPAKDTVPLMTDIDKLIDRHYKWKKEICILYYYEEVEFILSKMVDVFKSLNTLIEVKSPIVVCGDIHGQYGDLIKILKKFGSPIKTKYIFLGDYVDRGCNSMEVINFLFLLKLKYPNSIHLLRGNHELAHINKVYGFTDELLDRFGDPVIAEDMVSRYNEIFSYMPLAGCISKKILCMHGGISEEIESLDSIRDIKRPLVSVDSIACDLLWADPDDTIARTTFNDARGVSIRFGKEFLDEFLQKLKLDLIIRGHQVCPIGYALFNRGKLITVFSASEYDEEMRNLAGAIFISKDHIVQPISLKCIKTEADKDPEFYKNVKRSSSTRKNI
uniref:Serine/threonine-protein phosphatase n=1 Tax=Parastrongyloides trichosuri TaxID=131310 RepID=A0A0N4Z7B6_PARTI